MLCPLILLLQTAADIVLDTIWVRPVQPASVLELWQAQLSLIAMMGIRIALTHH